MNKERELLARAGLIIAQYRLSDPEDQALRELSEQINAYFEEPEVESKPIAYWDTQNGKLIPAVPLSSERTCFEVPLVPLYLHPPRPLIRMTCKEIGKLSDSVLSSDWTDEFELYHFARAIEDILEEKNK